MDRVSAVPFYKITYSGFAFYLIFIVGLLFSINPTHSEASNTLRVCLEGCPFSNIQSAIKSAMPGQSIEILPGVYRERQIIVDKTIQIRGDLDHPERVVIDGEGAGEAIFHAERSPNFEISGVTIKSTGISYLTELAGVRVVESKGCRLHHLRFDDTTYAIYLEKSTECEIHHNRIQGYAKDESSGGNGIHIWNGEGHIIFENQIQGHRDGIYLEFTKGSKIENNSVSNNLRYGLHFMSSNQTVYEKNRFSSNGAGVAVMYSRDIEMRENIFENNIGNASYGMLLKDIMNSKIEKNVFKNNTVGIFMEGSNRSTFLSNRFLKNGWALRIMGDCENNRFEVNDFLSNTFEVSTNADHSWNEFQNNYWSHYQGYDLNRDGTGDVLHRPVSLSSVILEKVDSSYILLKCPLFQLLDQIEKAFPALIPEALKDISPKMTPNIRSS